MSLELMLNNRLTPLWSQARALAASGVPIFPCHPGTKAPATKNGLHDSSSDPDQIDAWWSADPSYNIGVVPARYNWFVVDVDHLENENELQLVPTFTFRTPSGGKHYYYSTNLAFGNRVFKSASGAKIGEARSMNGYVMMAPSVIDIREDHLRGKPPRPEKWGTYTVEDAREAADLPQHIAAMMIVPERKEAAAPEADLDQPRDIARANEYIRRAEIVTEGNGSDDYTYKLAAAVLDFGISAEKAVELLSDWADDCGFDRDWLEEKVFNAAGYAQNEAGCRALPDPTTIAAFQAYAEQHTTKPLPGLNCRQMRARVPMPVVDLVPGWVEKGLTTFLVGVGGTHKSRLALQWGLSIAAGYPILGKPVEQCGFRFLSYEDDLDEVTRRFHAMDDMLKLPDEFEVDIHDLSNAGSPLAMIDEHNGIQWTHLFDELREALLAREGHTFLVIDSCYNAFLFAGQAKVNETCVGQLIGALDAFCRECNCTIIILWHPSDAGAEDGKGWSTAWRNRPRGRMQIKADKGGIFVLEGLKRSHSKLPADVAMIFERGCLVPADKSAKMDNLRAAAVAVAIAYSDGPGGQRIKRNGYSGKTKISAEHAIMRSLMEKTGVEYSVEQFITALKAAEDLKMLKYVDGGTGQAAMDNPAGWVAP